MNYFLFLLVAVAYNIRKFFKSKDRLLNDLHESNEVRRNTILSHFYWIFVVELFLGTLTAVFLSESDQYFGGLFTVGALFFVVSILGFFIYQAFLKWVAKQIDPSVTSSFTRYMIKEARVLFAVAFLPILLYSGMTQAFQDDIGTGFWGLEAIVHILAISVLSITCTVILMMKLLPNCEITEPEFLDIITKRLAEANLESVRVRWVEAEFKNAFVVGLNLPFFKNQTMFIGRPLRQALNLEEFDAVICHELAHIREGHMAKRIVALGWNILRITLVSVAVILFLLLGGFLVFGYEGRYHLDILTPLAMVTIVSSIVISYLLFFNAIRAQEYEADAIAVLDFGCSIATLESALKKLMAVDNPYAVKKKKHFILDSLSSHPSLEDRVAMLELKVRENLPYNYYISPYQKLGTLLLSCFKFRYIGTATALFCLGAFYTFNDLRDFSELRVTLMQSTNQELMESEYLNNHINDRPVFGHSNLYYVMMRKDRELIDHYLTRGASPAKVLFYFTIFKDEKMFAEYIQKLSDKIDDDTYMKMIAELKRQNPKEELLAQVLSSARYQKNFKEEQAQRMPASVETTSSLSEN